MAKQEFLVSAKKLNALDGFQLFYEELLTSTSIPRVRRRLANAK